MKDVEKLPGTCERDIVYSKAALRSASRKNFEKALVLVKKIEGEKQSTDVTQAIWILESENAIERKDVETVTRLLPKIASIESRAALYAQAARALANTRDGSDYLEEGIRLADKMIEPKFAATLVFSLATARAQSDPLSAEREFEKAVRFLNKAEPKDRYGVQIPSKVSLSCSSGDDTFWGGFTSLPNSNVFDALSNYANTQPDRALSIVNDIDDKAIKIRASARIAEKAIIKIKK